MDFLSQRNPLWANTKIGNSIYYMWAKGGLFTQLAQVLGVTPTEINERLLAIDGITEDGNILPEKLSEAFPGWVIAHSEPYDNKTVLEQLQAGNKVIVEVEADPLGMEGTHWVQYIGGGKCLNSFPDPAEEVPTSTFPGVKGFVILSESPQVAIEPINPPVEAPGVDENNYKGYDLSDKESFKTLIDAFEKK